LNLRETSNPMPPRSFRRGDCPSFKDLQEMFVGKVKIAPRVREREEKERAAVPVKKGVKEWF
jgi:hypothetical protein